VSSTQFLLSSWLAKFVVVQLYNTIPAIIFARPVILYFLQFLTIFPPSNHLFLKIFCSLSSRLYRVEKEPRFRLLTIIWFFHLPIRWKDSEGATWAWPGTICSREVDSVQWLSVLANGDTGIYDVGWMPIYVSMNNICYIWIDSWHFHEMCPRLFCSVCRRPIRKRSIDHQSIFILPHIKFLTISFLTPIFVFEARPLLSYFTRHVKWNWEPGRITRYLWSFWNSGVCHRRSYGSSTIRVQTKPRGCLLRATALSLPFVGILQPFIV